MSAGGAIPAPAADREAYLVWARTRVHRDRVALAATYLRRAAAHGPLAVATSWGKDSSALCHLALATLGPVPLVHLATSYRLPGWEVPAAYFAARTEVVELAAARSLTATVAWLRAIGLGYTRAGTSRRVAHGAKRDAVAAWADARGVAVQALGLRAEESTVRRGLLLGRGAVYTRRTDGVTVACPLAWWQGRDVWAYLYTHDVPYHPLYDCETQGLTRETLRNSGWLTTLDVPNGRMVWLRRHYPAQYAAIVAEWPHLAGLS